GAGRGGRRARRRVGCAVVRVAGADALVDSRDPARRGTLLPALSDARLPLRRSARRGPGIRVARAGAARRRADRAAGSGAPDGSAPAAQADRSRRARAGDRRGLPQGGHHFPLGERVRRAPVVRRHGAGERISGRPARRGAGAAGQLFRSVARRRAGVGLRRRARRTGRQADEHRRLHTGGWFLSLFRADVVPSRGRGRAAAVAGGRLRQRGMERGAQERAQRASGRLGGPAGSDAARRVSAGDPIPRDRRGLRRLRGHRAKQRAAAGGARERDEDRARGGTTGARPRRLSRLKAPQRIREKSMTESIRATLDAQRAAFRREGPPDVTVRLDRLTRLAQAVLAHEDVLIDALDADFGGRSRFAGRTGDILGTVAAVEYTKANLAEWMKPVRIALPPEVEQQGTWAEVHYEPLGVVGAIVPWDGPVLLASIAAIGAFGAGNRVMLKLSEFAPRTAEALRAAFGEFFDRTELA